MINESVIITESEFMIFINPKSEVKPDDVYNIIDDLCDGYALSTVIAFGFWGCTKQIFNKVGLMDERFIGGEYEDDDFIIRLIENDLAICWNFVEDNYDNSSPQIQTHTRGISANIFREKWNIDKQSKTIKDIASAASDIYDKTVRVYESFVKANHSIDLAKSKMDEAKQRLKDGSGSLTKKVEKMKKLGRLSTKKQLPDINDDVIN